MWVLGVWKDMWQEGVSINDARSLCQVVPWEPDNEELSVVGLAMFVFKC